ncbi:MAG: endonuclease [Gemmatimonadetes bacterium]|nr:endonuclease [Gemmatimonadota bacterium]
MRSRNRGRSLLCLSLLATSWIFGGCTARDGGEVAATLAVDSVRVLAYNIHHGEGMDEVLDLERIAALIRSTDPDLVALQEIDSVTARTERVDQASELGRLTGMQPFFGRFMAYDGGAYGMALLSKWDVRDVVNHRLPDGTEPRSALTATVVSPKTGRALRLVGIHFYETAEERLAQAPALEALLATDSIPTILAGDFNSTPESPVMTRLAQAWQIVDKGEDRLTFSSFDPVREIDFVLVRPGERFEVVGQRLLDEPVASDHRPVLVDLVVRP